MERPVRPEQAECLRIKKAMRAARIMKWGRLPVLGLAVLTALIVGGTSKWYCGVGLFVVINVPFFIFVVLAARCPRCGQVWWGEGALRKFGGVEYPLPEDETQSMVCRRCHLDIGYGMRE